MEDVSVTYTKLPLFAPHPHHVSKSYACVFGGCTEIDCKYQSLKQLHMNHFTSKVSFYFPQPEFKLKFKIQLFSPNSPYTFTGFLTPETIAHNHFQNQAPIPFLHT